MPIVRDWARQRDMAPSKFLIPLSYASIMGGMLTTIGTSTNLVVNGLLEAQGYEPFAFLEPAKLAMPVGAACLLFLVVLGPILLPGNKGGLFRQVREHGDNLVTAMELDQQSRFVGRFVADVISSVGLAPASLLSIRRRMGSATPMPRAPRAAVVGAQAAKPDVQAEVSATPTSESPVKDMEGSNGLTTQSPIQGGDVDLEALNMDGSTGLTAQLPNQGGEVNQEALNLVNDVRSRLMSLDTASSLKTMEDHMIELKPPIPPHERVKPGDVFLLSLDRDAVVTITSKQERGLRLSSVHAQSVVSSNSEFVELVLGPGSPMIGELVETGAELCESRYHSGLIALRRRQQLIGMGMGIGFVPDFVRQTSRGSDDESAHRRKHGSTFVAGDVMLVLAPLDQTFPKNEFLLVSRIAALPPPPHLMDLIPPIVFLVGLVMTIIDIMPMVQVAVTLACVFVLGGWVRVADIRNIVDWQLLILIGSALGLAEAMQQSGLAHYIAQAVLESGLPRALAPSGLYFVVMVVTELVTNNAAAALGVPLAISMAEEMGLKSPKPLVMVVMMAASTSYASPIGYATNLMVKGPGGYSFADFLRIGLIMDLLWLVGVSALLPLLWPLE